MTSNVQTGTAVGPGHLVPLAAATLLVLGLGEAIAILTPAGPRYQAAALLGVIPVAAAVIRLAPLRPPARDFGAANWITLLRGVIVALAAGLIAAPEALSGRSEHAWAPAVVAVLCMALDGVDGRLARRRRRVSAFGARFDIEVDAWTTLVLAALAVAIGPAPVWTLAIGLMHYLMRAAGHIVPTLEGPLPPSLRRRVVGGTQILALAALLAPPIPAGLAPAVAGAALSALVLSFALDVRLLLRNRAAGVQAGA